MNKEMLVGMTASGTVRGPPAAETGHMGRGGTYTLPELSLKTLSVCKV